MFKLVVFTVFAQNQFLQPLMPQQVLSVLKILCHKLIEVVQAAFRVPYTLHALVPASAVSREVQDLSLPAPIDLEGLVLARTRTNTHHSCSRSVRRARSLRTLGGLIRCVGVVSVAGLYEFVFAGRRNLVRGEDSL